MAKKKTAQGQTIIANMGLYWREDMVRWKGSKACPRSLAGVRANEKRGGVVDFWQQAGIYALYSDYGHLVYVGQAGLGDKSCIGGRLKQHKRDDLANRWRMFSWFGLKKVKANNQLGQGFEIKFTKKAELANVLEGILIEVAEPLMNNQKGRFGRRVERYLQAPVTPDKKKKKTTTDSKLDKILKQLSNLRKKVNKL